MEEKDIERRLLQAAIEVEQRLDTTGYDNTVSSETGSESESDGDESESDGDESESDGDESESDGDESESDGDVSEDSLDIEISDHIRQSVLYNCKDDWYQDVKEGQVYWINERLGIHQLDKPDIIRIHENYETDDSNLSDVDYLENANSSANEKSSEQSDEQSDDDRTESIKSAHKKNIQSLAQIRQRNSDNRYALRNKYVLDSDSYSEDELDESISKTCLFKDGERIGLKNKYFNSSELASDSDNPHAFFRSSFKHSRRAQEDADSTDSSDNLYTTEIQDFQEIANESIELARLYGNSIITNCETMNIPREHAQIIADFMLNNPRIFTKYDLNDDDVRFKIKKNILGNDEPKLPDIDFSKISDLYPIQRQMDESDPSVKVIKTRSISPATVDDTNNSLEYVSDDSGVDYSTNTNAKFNNTNNGSCNYNILPSIWSSSEDES